MRGCVGRDMVLPGLAVFRPSVALWANFLGDADAAVAAGSHADIWSIIVGALAGGEITCRPHKYRANPADFQEFCGVASALLNIAVVLGYRQATSEAAV